MNESLRSAAFRDKTRVEARLRRNGGEGERIISNTSAMKRSRVDVRKFAEMLRQ